MARTLYLGDRDNFKLNSYSCGLQLFSGVEHFPKPVEIALLPSKVVRGIL